MRIVNAMFGCGHGGIEQAIVDYCEALRHCGHEAVAIVHPRADVIQALKLRNIPTYTLPNIGAWDPIAVLRIKYLIRRLKPDISIAHGNRAVSLLKAAKAPTIVGVMHNYKINCEGLRFIFYPTQDLLCHIQRTQEPDTHFYLVPNMVRVAREMPVRSYHMPTVIGSMGRFVAKKGFELFIEALAELKAQGKNFRAVLAGDGEEMAALKALAQQKQLGGTLEFAGWVENKQVFFDSIDLFCLPSHHEPFGIVLLEAMAQALPVVATSSEGPSEILKDGIDGILVPKENPGALAKGLDSLLADRQYAAFLARNAYDTVRSRYDLTVVAQKLDLALRSLCRL